jgi:glycerophosphoryl diester phosphodiesterase
MHIELKEDTADLVADLIKKEGIIDSVVIVSFNPLFLEKIKKKLNVETGLIFVKMQDNILEQVKKAKINALHPLTAITNKSLVDLAHENNLKIRPWTANNFKEMYRLKALKVDGIYTDYPDRLKKVLESD